MEPFTQFGAPLGGFGEDGDAFIGPAWDLMFGEVVGEDDVRQSHYRGKTGFMVVTQCHVVLIGCLVTKRPLDFTPAPVFFRHQFWSSRG